MNLPTKQKQTHRRGKRFVVVKGEMGAGGQDQEFGINRGKTVYIGRRFNTEKGKLRR